MKFRGAILSWLAFLASLLFLLFAIAFGISASYHPDGTGNHLAPTVFQVAVFSVPVFFMVAVRHTGKQRRTKVLRNAMELAVLPIVMTSIIFIYAKINPQPDYLRIAYAGEVYAMPRTYSARSGMIDDRSETFGIDICQNRRIGGYGKGCKKSSYISLDTRQFIDRHAVSYLLNGVNAVYEGDVIMNVGEGARYLVDGSIHYPKTHFVGRMMLDEDNQIIRFMRCSKSETSCEVYARTPLGVLRLKTPAGGMDSVDFGRTDEKYWLSFIQAHKCTDLTCDGKFD